MRRSRCPLNSHFCLFLRCYAAAKALLTCSTPQKVLFLKEGAPEETAGPFHDDKYDDEALHEVPPHPPPPDPPFPIAPPSRPSRGNPEQTRDFFSAVVAARFLSECVEVECVFFARPQMQAACAPLADLPRGPTPPRSPDAPAVIALGLPVLSSLTKYDGAYPKPRPLHPGPRPLNPPISSIKSVRTA